MTCQQGDFVGTWKTTVGLRAGGELTVVEHGNRFELRDGEGLVDNDLAFDEVAFTLKSAERCMSLWKTCNHLFGVEVQGDAFQVWGAERSTRKTRKVAELSPILPDWRLDQRWGVEVVEPPDGSEPPVGIGDGLFIREEESPAADFGIFKNNDANSFDLLRDNSSNRTLDGDHRCVAHWDRGSSKNLVFAMVRVPELERQQAEAAGRGLDAIKELLKKLGTLLDFEIEILAKSLFDSSGSEGVWGAEEG